MSTTKDFLARMDEYAILPVEHRIEYYRREIKDTEAKILKIIDNRYEWDLCKIKKEDTDLRTYLSQRGMILSRMFQLHCTDSEIKQIKSQNEKLVKNTDEMFKRTAKVVRYILDSPIKDEDGYIEVRGTLQYCGEEAEDVLKFEDDDFYGSDFENIIPIEYFLNLKSEYHKPIHKSGWHVLYDKDSSMSDLDIGLIDTENNHILWDDTFHSVPALKDIPICHASHVLLQNDNFSIPDFIRLGTFRIDVDVRIQHFAER